MKSTLFLVAGAATTMAANLTQTIVDKHNEARDIHGAAHLHWSKELAKIAQGHANTCKYGHVVEPAGAYGQNIAWWPTNNGKTADPVEAFANTTYDLWYKNEIDAFAPYYGQASPPMNKFHDWGHATQVVWNSTYEVGCAYKSCDGNSALFLICDYRAPGNMAGEYAKNVFKPNSTASSS